MRRSSQLLLFLYFTLQLYLIRYYLRHSASDPLFTPFRHTIPVAVLT